MSHIDGDDHMTKDLIDSLESKDNDLSLVTSNTQIPDVEVANLTHDADEINQLLILQLTMCFQRVTRKISQ